MAVLTGLFKRGNSAEPIVVTRSIHYAGRGCSNRQRLGRGGIAWYVVCHDQGQPSDWSNSL